MVRSVRAKLTLWYAATVAIFLAVFVAMDVVGLKENLSATVAPAEMEVMLARALREHILLSLALLVPFALVGYLFIRKVLSPVRDMAAAARRISAEDLSLRIEGIRDTGEIGELAATLNGMIERLEISFAQTRQFSADVSHELRTPLTVLKGELSVCLKKERPAEEYAATLRSLTAQVDRMATVIEDMLLLARMEGPEANNGQRVALDTLLLEVYEEFSPMAREKGLFLELVAVDEVAIGGDPGLIRRMIANLVDNAIKYTDAGRIELSLRAMERGWVLTVSDTGHGIAADDLPRIFDRFYRADKSRSSRIGGAGLGLSLVKKIAELHGLRVSVDSAPEKGATFIIKN